MATVGLLLFGFEIAGDHKRPPMKLFERERSKVTRNIAHSATIFWDLATN
jgi:hypothetical protein